MKISNETNLLIRRIEQTRRNLVVELFKIEKVNRELRNKHKSHSSHLTHLWTSNSGIFMSEYSDVSDRCFISTIGNVEYLGYKPKKFEKLSLEHVVQAEQLIDGALESIAKDIRKVIHKFFPNLRVYFENWYYRITIKSSLFEIKFNKDISKQLKKIIKTGNKEIC